MMSVDCADYSIMVNDVTSNTISALSSASSSASTSIMGNMGNSTGYESRFITGNKDAFNTTYLTGPLMDGWMPSSAAYGNKIIIGIDDLTQSMSKKKIPQFVSDEICEYSDTDIQSPIIAGFKRFQCSCCGKKFRRFSHMKTHEETVHKTNIPVCQQHTGISDGIQNQWSHNMTPLSGGKSIGANISSSSPDVSDKKPIREARLSCTTGSNMSELSTVEMHYLPTIVNSQDLNCGLSPVNSTSSAMDVPYIQEEVTIAMDVLAQENITMATYSENHIPIPKSTTGHKSPTGLTISPGKSNGIEAQEILLEFITSLYTKNKQYDSATALCDSNPLNDVSFGIPATAVPNGVKPTVINFTDGYKMPTNLVNSPASSWEIENTGVSQIDTEPFSNQIESDRNQVSPIRSEEVPVVLSPASTYSQTFSGSLSTGILQPPNFNSSPEIPAFYEVQKTHDDLQSVQQSSMDSSVKKKKKLHCKHCSKRFRSARACRAHEHTHRRKTNVTDEKVINYLSTGSIKKKVQTLGVNNKPVRSSRRRGKIRKRCPPSCRCTESDIIIISSDSDSSQDKELEVTSDAVQLTTVCGASSNTAFVPDLLTEDEKVSESIYSSALVWHTDYDEKMDDEQLCEYLSDVFDCQFPHKEINEMYDDDMQPLNCDSLFERYVKDEWLDWEVQLFEEAMVKYGKEFNKVSNWIKSRSVKECVSFYYKWKGKLSEYHKSHEVRNRNSEYLSVKQRKKEKRDQKREKERKKKFPGIIIERKEETPRMKLSKAELDEAMRKAKIYQQLYVYGSYDDAMEENVDNVHREKNAKKRAFEETEEKDLKKVKLLDNEVL